MMIDDFLLQSQVTKYHRLGAGTTQVNNGYINNGYKEGWGASSTRLNIF